MSDTYHDDLRDLAIAAAHVANYCDHADHNEPVDAAWVLGAAETVLTDVFGGWKPPALAGYWHDWELVSRWEGEPWAASLRPTAHYDNRQRTDILDAIRAVAREEEIHASLRREA